MMLDRLEHDDKDPERPRRELDRLLEIDEWHVVSRKSRVQRREPGTPYWWRGDEDASQSFLNAMGVVV
jgi:hypothetical protein